MPICFAAADFGPANCFGASSTCSSGADATGVTAPVAGAGRRGAGPGCGAVFILGVAVIVGVTPGPTPVA